MGIDFNRIQELEKENMIMKSEIQRLKNLLEDAGVDYSVKESAQQGTSPSFINRKTDVIIYDYVDTHIKVFDRMYHKRLRAYKKIGYEITLKLSDEKQKTNAIFDAETFIETYKTDLSQANSEIVISSPGINSAKIRQLIHIVTKKQAQGVKISVITIPPADYPDNSIEPTKKLIDELRRVGIYVKETSVIHEHFAVIDKEIVWYGSMNMLSRAKEYDNLMRVNSKEIADELLEIGLGKT